MIREPWALRGYYHHFMNNPPLHAQWRLRMSCRVLGFSQRQNERKAPRRKTDCNPSRYQFISFMSTSLMPNVTHFLSFRGLHNLLNIWVNLNIAFTKYKPHLGPQVSSTAHWDCKQTTQQTSVCLPPQDALLRLAAVVDTRSLRAALQESIQELLPSTVFSHTHTHT